MDDELAGKHPAVEKTPGAAQTAASVGGDTGRCGPEHGLREGAGAGGDDSRDTRPNRATRYVETTRGILSYSELAPFLAERVAAAEADLYREVLASRALNESLLLDLHARVCADLVPDWAGNWRNIEVRVGNLTPPPPHEVPLRMRDYALDLQARWPEATRNLSDLTLEFLAFAEGRFLTIHPFRDFNGRIIRLFLRELLRRLDFPRVILEPDTEGERAIYFTALEAADRNNFQPLLEIWRSRLTRPEASQA
jgi:CRISPR-associated endonuclease/helicase Cas3